MFVVRYAALLALVFWVGVTFRETAWITASGYVTPLVCGGVLIASLLVLKFVGPPPYSFFPRIAIVATMLALAVYDLRAPSNAISAVELALGCVLLGWYAREP
jgi:hypothetical protein